ncbi:hypothetical protein OPV22_015135 [Ensete ventricosum]|uniref:RRM domain-containing protein n=1 Tax=Ensete ventricosum TaxID=4639 RepID=A0AAV8PRY6_ENSVE|nr:hypothetical protein OPV22_015135 [Ensete ventricosum]
MAWFLPSLRRPVTFKLLLENKFGHLVEAKIVVDKFSGRSRGFGFVTFDDKDAMEDAIEAMNGMDLDGRSITVERAQPQGNALLVMVHEGIGMVVERTDTDLVVAVIADMDLTGMGIVSAVGTEMGEAVGVMEVIVIIVNALVHMNALVEAVVAIDLDPVAASVPAMELVLSLHN